MERCFYYSEPWRSARERVPGPPGRLRVQWWDTEEVVEDILEAEVIENPDLLIDPAINPSPRGRLDGLVETFVCGWPRNRLIRKAGFGMDPPFQRMQGRYSPAVEMRTEATRTFGFFVRKGVFVAHRLDLADNTHADPSLYGQYGDAILALLARLALSEKDETSDVDELIGD